MGQAHFFPSARARDIDPTTAQQAPALFFLSLTRRQVGPTLMQALTSPYHLPQAEELASETWQEQSLDCRRLRPSFLAILCPIKPPRPPLRFPRVFPLHRAPRLLGFLAGVAHSAAVHLHFRRGEQTLDPKKPPIVFPFPVRTS